MRELKFRVWDNTIKKFNPEIYKAGEEFGHPSSCDWQCQQYTGLKDKNNKEIYEGDLVKIQINDDPEDLEWEIDKVVYDMGAFRLNSRKQWDGDLLSDYINFDGFCDFEVIGNIFENPELSQ